MAALTIPSLVVKNQEKERIVQLKKVYNVFSNAFSLAVVQYGKPDGWQMEAYAIPGGTVNPEGGLNGAKYLLPFLQVARICALETGCFPNARYKLLNGSFESYLDKDDRGFKMMLADGTSVAILGESSFCQSDRGDNKLLKNICGSMIIDVNGFKGPNQRGVDTFSFYIGMNGIVPKGMEGSLSGDDIVACRTSGWQCTAWALYKGNMDYIHRDVSWDE